MSIGLNYNPDRSQQVTGSVNGARGDSLYEYETEAHRIQQGNALRAEEEDRLAGSTTAPFPTSAKAGGGSTNPSETNQEGYVEGQELVRELTRQLSRRSTNHTLVGNPFIDEAKDPAIDPNSPNFNARKWMQTVLGIRSRDENAHPGRTSGISFRNLSAFGYSDGADYQKTVSNLPLQITGAVKSLMGNKGSKVQILRDFDGLVKAGEMCVVLGPPGSGCSTFLKTISGETHGFYVDGDLNYQGISAKMMHKNFRGEAIYTAEQDIHFPQLTVHQTLSFAAEARAPRHPPAGITKREYANYMADVVMAIFGISHTRNTRVGNEFVRGVSGGERKRVSIAEAALSGAPLQCWDNSTRGLDAANAVEFVKTLRLSTELTGATALVAIYQSPQAAYDYFDKALVLYEGKSIYFGNAKSARNFFIDMGFHCPERQTTPDFLTSLTSPQERSARQGFENKVPRTPDEFEARWKASNEYKALIAEIEAYDKEFPIGGEALEKFKESRRAQQAKNQSVKSPYTLSYGQQIKLCLRRGFWRLKADPSLTLTQIFGNSAMAFIVSSIFFNLQPTTSSFFQRSALLFFAVLLNAFGSALEILTLYAQRPIIEKHSRYALYHPSAESYASMLTDLPYKISNTIVFNCILYFMTNLNRQPGNFFFFLFVSFILTLTMSMLFRTIASVSRTLSQALAPAAILILAIVIYTGFALPITYMLGWSRWINYLNPVAYGFESLMINEFYGRDFQCSQFIPSGPGYDGLGAPNQVCQSPGTIAGTNLVSGGDYIALSFQYLHSHKWRNVGIIFAFMLFLLSTYLAASEFISAKKSKGEILVFRRGHEPAILKDKNASKDDVEAATKGEKVPVANGNGNGNGEQVSAVIQRQTAIFHWQDVCYDIKIKSEERRILDHVDGWVKPGQLTALMGVSGAGKTTLLDVLATRVTMGVVSGEMLVDGRLRDGSFQRKTGYVQQQDLHLETSTVREALEFSAILRQPGHVPKSEKLAYVDEIIKLLDMEPYADAVVGILGEGLNVEQRKRLTIGVEMVAKPELLLFLDEPTSGLDSQTSWSILDLLKKLTDNGQAILCTIHQPSAMLFSRFDRLLFLAKGGQTVYFGEVGENSHVLTKYFEANGAHPCPPESNPAEWMLEVIGAAPGTRTEINWHETWKNSPEFRAVRQHLADLKENRPKEVGEQEKPDKSSYRQFAATTPVQIQQVTKRVFQQLWRTPSYIYSKTALCVFSALFIGFSFFKSPLSSQGLQNQMFSFFLLLTIFGQIVQQIMPHFVKQRELYEARERPSKTYSWQVFMLSNIVSEIPYGVVMGTLIFFCWYYPIGMYENATYTNTVHARGALMWAFLVQFLVFTSTFTHMIIAAIPTAETAGNIANLMFSLTLLFCGVLATPEQFPGFWIFMYRVSPFTYMVDGILSTGLANAPVTCSDLELVTVQPTAGTCEQYLSNYANMAGSNILNPNASADCQICPLSSTNGFLNAINASYDLRFRNFGILWAFVAINIAGAFFFYWLGRVPKNPGRSKKEKTAKKA